MSQSHPTSSLSATLKDGSLIVQGIEVGEEPGMAWTARQIDDRHILLSNDEAHSGLPSHPHGIGGFTSKMLKAYLTGLHGAGWSGMIGIDTGCGVKRLYFSRGSIVFAASNLIDDRLGEVIYREARITLDELTNSAAQVSKSRKFGQVLIASGIFSNVELWSALKLQVKQILRSIFMVEHVFFAQQEDGAAAPTEVVFEESPAELINESYSFGCAFRDFLGKLRAETAVHPLLPQEQTSKEFQPGTFIGDLLQIIAGQNNVQELLNASKLIDLYTVAALFQLVNLGLCRIEPDIEDMPKATPEIAPLKAKIDAYAYVLQQVHKAFADGGKEFPARDVQAFAAGLNPDGFPSLFLDTQGALRRDCIGGIFSQCTANPERIAYFAVRLECLIQFVLQVAGDNLAFEPAKRIRQEYRSLSA